MQSNGIKFQNNLRERVIDLHTGSLNVHKVRKSLMFSRFSFFLCSKRGRTACPISVNFSGVTPANQTKERPIYEPFRGQTGTKVRCESRWLSQGKAPEFTTMCEIHELCVLALSLAWFAGATPDLSEPTKIPLRPPSTALRARTPPPRASLGRPYLEHRKKELGVKGRRRWRVGRQGLWLEGRVL